MRRGDLAKLVKRFVSHPGRGGCGVGAIADLKGPSHELVELALRGLGCMEHRGGVIDDTGDGAGLQLAVDPRFFARFIAPGRRLPEGHELAVGVVFFPVGERTNLPHWQHEIDQSLRRHGLAPLGWRQVPVDEGALGRKAWESRRDVWQCLIGEGMVTREDFAPAMWRVKAAIERNFRDLYLPSWAPRTLVYKALATGEQLKRFYADLRDPTLTTDCVVFHRRYSTNTFSNWYLAQVFRLICHNGEINTIKANRNAVRNLEAELGWHGLLMAQGSDSADVDRIVEMFHVHGVPLDETMCRIMPMAWRDLPRPTPEIVRFFQGVQRALGNIGAWEGPAALVASDGEHLVAGLDRMGLRPLRFMVTRSGRVFIGSELGAIYVDPSDIAKTGQLDPGEAVAVDVRAARVRYGTEILDQVVRATHINFAELAERRLEGPPPRAPGRRPPKPEQRWLNLFGWTSEKMKLARYLAENGKEPITSMGNDRPLAVFSAQRPPLYRFFKQIVAVVTNPPIDPIREGSAFDLTTHLGPSPLVHENEPVYEVTPQYRLPGPFLTEEQIARMRDSQSPDKPRCEVLDATFEEPGGKAIARRIAELCRQAVQAVKKGAAEVILLSDRRALVTPASEDALPRLPLPMVLVVSAVHNALTAEGLRRRVGLAVEVGDVQEGHDAAVLLAVGATAICPYLLLSVGGAGAKPPEGDATGFDPVGKLLKALDETLKRIMSKMGICSIDGYRGSGLFEAVGIAPEVVDYYLPGITSRIGGVDLDDLSVDIRWRWERGSAPQREPDVNVYRKEVWHELQLTARGNEGAYQRFLAIIDETPPVYLRDLLEFRSVPAGGETPMAAVASAEDIVASTFRGAAMSHGALHRVAHRAIAAAFNHFGAFSNCGEGGEDPRRDRGGPWEESRSRIRQFASGRFGVDARYLVHADEISIKIGQGAKPGEGGHLPAEKVTVEVAAIRKTRPGVALISPPPHHDIYSIEDLAQVIYNLKQCNPRARVSVKIPAVTDIGTIAVGIAKAGADVIDISGMEGGTGAAASSSIEHAGLPLERALSEVQQALCINGIRPGVRLRADGGLKTGYDVAVVLALGADEVSLGTALMIAEQCIFCHGCALGNCPAGITTQDDLVARRLMTIKKGRGADTQLPDEEEQRFYDARSGVERYLLSLAGDLRGILSRLGLRRPQDLVGRVDLLAQLPTGDARCDKVDLSELLLDASGRPGTAKGARTADALVADPTSVLNAQIVGDVRAALSRMAAADGGAVRLEYDVVTSDRAIGATLAGKLTLRELALPPGGVTLALRGYAGQALGFALCDGMRIELVGYANDTVGEAMSGGIIVVRQPEVVADRSAQSAIGNAACYGATGGTLLVEGRAGQRLGVRMSDGLVVAEGAGKYAFEYMTGGVGVVVGPVGPVVASGMTGGVVYLYDEDGETAAKVHRDARATALPAEEAPRLREILELFAAQTGSERARALLADFPAAAPRFLKIVSAI
jgi:glutamate synthase domain-containing protein 2/glutamate synthase domain-containing protein 1/glutamate synthase domain-containing protein 3